MKNLKNIRKSKHMSQQAVADKVGITQSTFAKYERGEVEPRPSTLNKIAEVLGVTVQELISDASPAEISPSNVSQFIQQTPILPQPRAEGLSAPVYASAQAGTGETTVNLGDVVEWRMKPISYQHVKDIYGLYVIDTSMVPRLEPGEVIWIHPHKPPKAGDDAVFIKDGLQTGDTQIAVKKLVSVSSKAWTVQQYNPQKTFDLPRSEWKAQLIVDIELQN